MTADLITLKRIATLHPAVQQMALPAYRRLLKWGLGIRVTDTVREWEEQAAAYAQGRTAPGPIITWAPPGLSYHNYALAFDFCLLLRGKEVSWSLVEDMNHDGVKDFEEAANCFKYYGLSWGGDFPGAKSQDRDHIQLTVNIPFKKLEDISCKGKILNFDIPGVYENGRFLLEIHE